MALGVFLSRKGGAIMLERVRKVSVFTTSPTKGNPAGVVLGADDLSRDEMQVCAKKVGLSETVFCLNSEHADLRLRFFMPDKETPLCGHGTLGAVWLFLKESDTLISQTITVETEAGQLTLNYDEVTEELTMSQCPYQCQPFNGDRLALCRVLGISEADLAEELPLEYGSTGVWTLLVPVKNAETLERMQADNQLFPHVLTDYPYASIHPYAPSQKEGIDYEARHFSSATAGVTEDPVTGTASGSMVGALVKYSKSDQLELTIEQGASLGKAGLVRACALNNQSTGEYTISISGRCCLGEF